MKEMLILINIYEVLYFEVCLKILCFFKICKNTLNSKKIS